MIHPMIYDLNNKIKEQKDFIVQLQLLNMDSKRNLIGKLRNKMDLLENMEQLIDLKEDLILHHLDVQLQEQENCVMWLF